MYFSHKFAKEFALFNFSIYILHRAKTNTEINQVVQCKLH